jgi:hypothetical protein
VSGACESVPLIFLPWPVLPAIGSLFHCNGNVYLFVIPYGTEAPWQHILDGGSRSSELMMACSNTIAALISFASLNACKFIMRLERAEEEHLDLCLVQMDSRYDEALLREFVRVPENESPHPRAGVRNRCDDDYGLRPVTRRGPCHSMRLASGS